MAELVDDIPPAVPPRSYYQSSNNVGGYANRGIGYSNLSGYGINSNSLGRRVGYGSAYETYGR